MAIIRVHKHTDNYSIIENTAARDKRLSWKAKGIHWYCLTQPDDWEVIQGELVKHANGGKAALTSGIRELVQYGYWNINTFQDIQGRFQTIYDVFESPELNTQFQHECQQTGKQDRTIAIKSRKKQPLSEISNGTTKMDEIAKKTIDLSITENQQRSKEPLPKISNGVKNQKNRYRKSVTTKDYIDLDLEEEKEYKEKEETDVSSPPPFLPDNETNPKKRTYNKKPKEPKKHYGEEDIVLLTEDQYRKLITKFGEIGTQRWIRDVELYVGSTGKKYKSHYHTILKWDEKDKKERQEKGLKSQREQLPKNLRTALEFVRQAGVEEQMASEKLFK